MVDSPPESICASTIPGLAEIGVTCLGVMLDGNLEGWCQAAGSFVSETEKSRAHRFVQRIDAARHLVGRALVRRVLAQAMRVRRITADFVVNQWGKPRLDGCPIEFSISHTGNMVWAAFCNRVPVGIDVEKVNSAIDPLELAKFLHPLEAAEILRLPADAALVAFHRCWVRKEAVLKALGEGLHRPLDSFRVMTDAREHDWLDASSCGQLSGWTTADIDTCFGYQCSVAALARNLPVTVESM